MTYRISISTKMLSKVIRLRACMVAVINKLQQIYPETVMEETFFADRCVFKVHIYKGHAMDKVFRRMIGEELAEYICECKEPEMIYTIIRKEHSYRDHEEIQEIKRTVDQLLEGSAWEHARVVYMNRRQKLAKQLFVYLKDNEELAIDGFVRFRLFSYTDALSRCVREAVAEYVLDQEYKEFIFLLRSFVTIQSPNTDLVHVVHAGKSRFQVLKEDGTKLKLKDVEGVLKDDLGIVFSHEDLVVSTLLSALPEKVILHTQNPDEALIRTLMQVFQGRIDLCLECRNCRLTLDSHGDT